MGKAISFEHPAPFLVMALTTGLMMFDFSFFREQLCLIACPYGRFQSVLLDRKSLIVAYDRNRGNLAANCRRICRLWMPRRETASIVACA